MDPQPRDNPVGDALGLDISYMPTPDFGMMYPQFNNDPHVTFWGMARTLFPTARRHALEHESIVPSPRSGHKLPPNERLACFDFLYYVGAADVSALIAFWLMRLIYVSDHSIFTWLLRPLNGTLTTPPLGVK